MTKLRWSVAGLALATFPCLTALAATPFVLDDYYLLATVSEPAFSPGGDRVAYTLSRNDKKGDQATSDLWSVPWSGGKPAQLTRTPKSSESQPRYASDGKSLFFLSDAGEDEVTQLWRLKGGGARRVTNIPGGISDYDLSPDGKRAVVIAEVGRNVGSKAEIAPPIETDRFLFKLDGKGYLDDRTQQLFIVDIASGKARQLTSGQRDHWHPVWSPDGSSLAYTAKERGESDRDSNYDVFVQRVDAGEAKKISTSSGPDNDPDWYARPSWSPDSRRVLWLEGGESKWIYYATAQLAVADVATGEVTRPARIDRWFYYPKFAPDGSILALVEQDRDTWLARITGDKIEYLSSGKRFGYDFAVARDGRVVLLETDVITPAELFAMDTRRQLTHHNAWTADRSLGEVRDVSFASGDAEIHGYVTLPAGFDPAKRYPLLTDIHGGPVYQHSHE